MGRLKKKVALVTTGGTIASTRNAANKLESGKLNGNEILAMCQLEQEIDIVLVDLFQVPSMHMSFEHLNTLHKKIIELLQDPKLSGIVVTHGTDSLEETAYFLELTIMDKRPVIVTGSQKSPSDPGTDVYANLRNSLLVAADDSSDGIGTCVVFNEKIVHAKYVKKIHSSSINGFGSIGYGMLGFIDNDEVIIYQKPTKREHYAIQPSYPQVEIVYAHLGAGATILELLATTDVKGVVLVGAGRGQITPAMTDAVQKLCQQGVKIVLTTATDEGRVFPTYDYYGSANNLEQHGVIMGGDFDAKKACMKLRLMLANHDQHYATFMH